MKYRNSLIYRLAKELNVWVMGHKQEEIKKQTENKEKSQRRKVFRKKYKPLEKMRAAMEDLHLSHNNMRLVILNNNKNTSLYKR